MLTFLENSCLWFLLLLQFCQVFAPNIPSVSLSSSLLRSSNQYLVTPSFLSASICYANGRCSFLCSFGFLWIVKPIEVGKFFVGTLEGLTLIKKWKAIKSKISECRCNIVYLQELKRETFDDAYLISSVQIIWRASNSSPP